MKSAADRFDEAAKQQVNEAVSAAEGLTAAEIVPVVATASGRYDRAEDMVGLWLGVAAMAVAWALVPAGGAEPGGWGGSAAWLQPLAMVAGLLVGLIVGVAVASRVGWLQALFTPAGQQAAEVDLRARQAFFDSTVHHTAGASGVLLFVSLLERRAVVLGDRSVLEAVGQETIDGWCASLTGALREGDVIAALCSTIAAVGERLHEALPRQADDVNELSDALVTLDAL